MLETQPAWAWHPCLQAGLLGLLGRWNKGELLDTDVEECSGETGLPVQTAGVVRPARRGNTTLTKSTCSSAHHSLTIFSRIFVYVSQMLSGSCGWIS